MVSYNSSHTAERPVIDHAHAKGRAVFVKKGLVSGHIGNPGEAAQHIRFVTGTAGVTSLIFGSISPQNIRANARAVAT
jgi:hypothetical protein